MNPTTESIESPETVVTKRSVFQDVSLWFLLLSNVVTIYFAVTEGWDLRTVLLVYLCQSVSVGIFTVVKMLLLQEYTFDGYVGYKIFNREPIADMTTKLQAALLFVIHYGIFHLVYFFFLYDNYLFDTEIPLLSLVASGTVVIPVVMFFLNHCFSYFYNNDIHSKKQSLGNTMISPYVRVIPMQLFMFTYFLFPAPIIFFLTLKTFIDVLTHIIQHYSPQQNSM